MLGIDVKGIARDITPIVQESMQPMLDTMDEMLAEVRRTNELLEQLVENTKPKRMAS